MAYGAHQIMGAARYSGNVYAGGGPHDLAGVVVVDADVPSAKVVGAARSADKKMIADVSLFDVFQGGDLGAGQKSLALTVVLQPKDKTLTDAEIDAIADKVVDNVNRTTGGVLRG